MSRAPLGVAGTVCALVLTLAACSDPAHPQAGLETRRAALDSPQVTILSPTPFAVIPGGTTETPVDLVFTVSGHDARAHFYIDDTLLDVQGPPAGLYTFADVPRGQHRLSIVLATPEGVELTTPGATASVVIRVAPGCYEDAHCDDGNPCSAETCSANTCRYGPAGSALCCTSRFDCAVGPGGARFCDGNVCRECRAPEDCDDGNECTVDTCAAGRCRNVADPTCCARDADCDDGDGCTPDRCADRVCVHDPAPPGCCTVETAGFRCDDGDPCTIDSCIGRVCRHGPRAAGCCATAADCDDGNPCTLDRCDADTDRCEHLPDPAQPDCCDAHWQCDDFDPATVDSCEDHVCEHVVDTRYCERTADCVPSDNPCTQVQCIARLCTVVPLWGCCQTSRQCNDGNPCTTDACQFNSCVYTPIPNCCVSATDCDDRNPCNIDSCIGGQCRHGPNAKLVGCCASDAGCNDRNVCTVDVCSPAHQCLYSVNRAAGCCATARDCDDGNPATLDTCAGGSCRNVVDTRTCADAAGCDDTNPCTTDTCSGGRCSHVWQADCCLAAADCDDGRTCTRDVCSSGSNRCAHIPQVACCESDADCDDGDLCTADVCLLGRCSRTTIVGCCRSDAACDDGNPCTTDTCDPQRRRCTRAPRKGPGCCNSDASCDDGDPCTYERCIDFRCNNIPKPACCRSHADCVDADPCSADWCIFGYCRHFDPATAPYASDIPSACCASDFDCPDDGNPCTQEICSAAGYCTMSVLSACPASIPYFQTFHLFRGLAWNIHGWNRVDLDGQAEGAWGVASEGALGPDQHLSFAGGVPTGPYRSCAVSPVFDLRREGPPITVSFEHALTGVAAPTTVSLVAIVNGDVSAPLALWQRTYDADVETSATALLPPALYGQRAVLFGFCVAAGGADAVAELSLDTVIIVREHAPVFVSSLPDQTVPADSRVVLSLRADDADSGDVLSIALLEAPPFVSLGQTFFRPSDGTYHADLTIVPVDESNMGVYRVRAAVSDGLLAAELSFLVTVIRGHCGNGVLDPQETDVDCGAECDACRDGQRCAVAADCVSGHCDGGVCCTSGNCCLAPSDCPASYVAAPVCDLARRCQGHRMDATCEANVCGTVRVEDDSACGPTTLANRCGYYPAVYCTGEPLQVEPACADTCSASGPDDDASCDAIAHCDDGLCVGDQPDGGPCDEASDCQSGICTDGVCRTPCAGVANCPPGMPYCEGGLCHECQSDDDPLPFGRCVGVCGLVTPRCVAGFWQCAGPGYEPVETTCDGFDNDCDGEIDEGACLDCAPDTVRVRAALDDAFDIDFDFECNTWLATVRPNRPDGARFVPAAANQAVIAYPANAAQDLPFALVDPNPDVARVVAVYGCPVGGGCTDPNGLALLADCDGGPDCECTGAPSCPGFPAAPFFAAVRSNTAVTFAGLPVTTPTGATAGPDGAYWTGNFQALACAASDCTACDPDHPGVWCDGTRPPCCAAGGPLGRLVRFDTPDREGGARFREVHRFAGETILGLAAGRDGTVAVGTRTPSGGGKLWLYDPVADSAALVATLSAPVFSITQDRRSGEWYVETRGTPKLRRYDEEGVPLPMAADVPPNPDGEGVVQYGPDGRLYRLVPAARRLEDYALPGDRDGDGVPDDVDVFPDDGGEWEDTDGDGVGDNGDAFPDDPTEWSDRDGDGVGDNADVFPDDPTEWADQDGDGIGDNSDPDVDGDNWGNDVDNCRVVPNPDQADFDGDGLGDACDDDDDGDGSPDAADCRPLDPRDFPGAPERCDDGLDNDCDGAADEGCVAQALLGLTASGFAGAPVGPYRLGVLFGQALADSVAGPAGGADFGVAAGVGE
jgi:hypothetical protein